MVHPSTRQARRHVSAPQKITARRGNRSAPCSWSAPVCATCEEGADSLCSSTAAKTQRLHAALRGPCASLRGRRSHVTARRAMAFAQGNGAHTVRLMPPELLAELLRGPDADSIQVVDVRDDDFGDGCVAGAWNVPSKSLQTEPAVDALKHQLAREQRTTVVVHCLYSQQRGPACAARLVERLNAGVSGQLPLQVCVLQGGWMNWRKTYGGEQDLTTPLPAPE